MNTGLEVEGYDTIQHKDFNSRKEIEQYLTKMDKFLSKKANFGVMNDQNVMLEYDAVRELSRKINKVNKAKDERFDKFADEPFKHKGKEVGITVRQQANPDVGMGDSRYSEFRGLKFNPHRFRSNSELKERLKEMDHLYFNKDFIKESDAIYREHYIKGLRDELGAEHLAKRILEMDMDEFMKMYYTENNADIRFIYDKVSKQARITELEKVWGITPRAPKSTKKGKRRKGA